jgi:hypothetical protein
MDFNKICNDILNLTKEENKEEFLKNYSTYKNILNDIEKEMNENSVIDENTTIENLFEQLHFYENKVNTSTITVKELKFLKNLTDLINIKLQKEKLNIIEIK